MIIRSWISRGEGTNIQDCTFWWNLPCKSHTTKIKFIVLHKNKELANISIPTVEHTYWIKQKQILHKQLCNESTNGHFAVNTEKHYRYPNGSFDFLMTTSGGLTAILNVGLIISLSLGFDQMTLVGLVLIQVKLLNTYNKIPKI